MWLEHSNHALFTSSKITGGGRPVPSWLRHNPLPPNNVFPQQVIDPRFHANDQGLVHYVDKIDCFNNNVREKKSHEKYFY